MKSVIKGLITLSLFTTVVATTISLPNNAIAAQTTVNVTIDGVLQTYEQPATLNDGSVFVPFRPIFQAFGTSVHWDQNNRIVTAYKDNQIISLTIGDHNASVDNVPFHLEQAPTIMEGSTMVPIRFISEALGAQVNWNSDTSTVEIKKPTRNESENVYGFTFDFPQSWKNIVKVEDNTNDSSVISTYPLRNGNVFRFYLTDFGDPSVSVNFFEIHVFNQTVDEWKADKHPGYTYLTTKNHLTFAYMLLSKDAQTVKSQANDAYQGNNTVTDDQFKKLEEIFTQLPNVISTFKVINEKPEKSTSSFRSYEGTWTTNDVAEFTSFQISPIKIKFITDKAAILTVSDWVDTVIQFNDNGFSGSLKPLSDTTLSMSDGNLTLRVPVIRDGMRSGSKTITYTHEK